VGREGKSHAEGQRIGAGFTSRGNHPRQRLRGRHRIKTVACEFAHDRAVERRRHRDRVAIETEIEGRHDRHLDMAEAQAGSNRHRCQKMRGLEQVRGKTDWWEKNMEVHQSKVSGPFVARDKFVVQFDIDATDKSSGKREKMTEVGIYTVKDGKVVREEFMPLVGK